MRIKNKILSFVLALCLIIPCALVFTGCDKDKDDDKPAFVANQNVLTLANETISDLTLIYNRAPASQTFSVAEMKATWETEYAGQLPATLADFSYYVEVGEVDEIDNINSITLGSKFTKNQTFKLSLGKNAQLEDKVFYEDDDKLYIAAPVIVFETVNLGKIKINDTEFEFDLGVEATVSNFTSVEFQSGATSTAAKVSDTEYNIDIKEANKYIKFTYEGSTADDVILTKKVRSDSVSYGLTKLEANNFLGLYPVAYSSKPLTEEYLTNYHNTTMNYSVYVIDSGVHSVTLNFSVILPEA